ncbi:MAG: V-type ATPase 116kDa subunit family protein [Brevinematia bacterium]
MFFPEKMVEINILTTDEFLKDISDYLIKFGEFEVKRVGIKEAQKLLRLSNKDDDEVEKFSNIKMRLDRLAVNMKVDDIKIRNTLSEREPLSLDEIDLRLTKAENEFYSAYAMLSNLEREEVDLRIKKLQYSIRKDLESRNIPKEFFTALLIIAKHEAPTILRNISSLPTIIEEVESFKSLSVILVSLPYTHKNEILKLSTSFLKIININEIITEDVNLAEIEKRLREIEVEQKKLRGLLDRIVETNTEEILTLYKGLWFSNTSMKLKSSSIRGGRFIVFSGWIPKKREEEVCEKIREITNDICVVETKDAENTLKEDKNTQIPTKLNNPKFLKSFESIVKLYSIPRFYEIDPTVIFTILYVIFYGMMFGDVGQGLALSLISALLFWKFKSFRVIGGLGIAVGLSSAVFGFLYGSVFGIEGKIIPSMWTSPLHDVLEIMKVSIVTGFIVISIGLILSVINTAREKNIPRLILGNKGIAGVLFYFSLVGYPIYILLSGTTFNPNLMLFGILVPILMFVTEAIIEAKKHGHSVSPVSIFFELFEVFISFVSNTVSFIRIAGFALNHTALMITFFSIAEVVKGGVIGDILALLIVVFGQIFIIVFEGLVVGIQALRLSFYEFFTKFFRGGGKAFEPLK